MIIDEFNLYKKMGIRFGGNGINATLFLTTYYLKYHIEDALRCLKAIEDKNCYNSELFGDFKDKLNRIQYYHHFTFSLLSNLGLAIDGQRQLKKQLGEELISLKIEKEARNTLEHIFDKLNTYSKLGVTLSGFNIIEDEQDLSNIKIEKPLGLLDLINKKIIIFGNKFKKGNKLIKIRITDLTLDFIYLKDELEKAKQNVNEFYKFVKDQR